MQTTNYSLVLGNIFQQLRELERMPRKIPGVGNVSPSELHLIEQIGLEGKVTSKELSQQQKITKGAVSQLVKKLQQQNLIQREAMNDDKRAYTLCLTALGETVFEEHRKIQQAFDELLNLRLSPNEKESFTKGLVVLSEALASQLKEEADNHER